MSNLLNGDLPNIANILAAVGALGAAAYGLVDLTKACWGGVSNVGFKSITKALTPFQAALDDATVNKSWRKTLKAHWLNGTAEADQKATAKGLIRLGLSPSNANALSTSGRVNAVAFKAAVTNVENGTPLSPTDLNVLGRFDASVDAALDAGYESADQAYRNAARAVAALVAIVLAIAGGAIVDAGAPNAPHPFDFFSYLFSMDGGMAVIIGIVAVPLAPVAKDLASSLQNAVAAFKAVKG